MSEVGNQRCCADHISRWDRYLGMTAPMTQVPVPPAITLRVAALQSIMKPYFTPHLYLYLYIYINIKYFFDIYCYWENNCNTATLRGIAQKKTLFFFVNTNIIFNFAK